MNNQIPQSYLTCAHKNPLFNGEPVIKFGPEGVYECMCEALKKSIATVENWGRKTSFEMKEKIGDVTYSTCSVCKSYSKKKVISPADSVIPAEDELKRQLQVI